MEEDLNGRSNDVPELDGVVVTFFRLRIPEPCRFRQNRLVYSVCRIAILVVTFYFLFNDACFFHPLHGNNDALL